MPTDLHARRSDAPCTYVLLLANFLIRVTSGIAAVMLRLHGSSFAAAPFHAVRFIRIESLPSPLGREATPWLGLTAPR